MIYVIVSCFVGIFGDSQALVGFFWLFVIIGIFFAIYEVVFYNSIQFLVTDDKITIDSGIITQRSKTIPFQNVQNVDTVSGVLQQMFGISTLNIWTASPGQFGVAAKKGSENTLHDSDGRLWLDTQDAQWLKNFVASKGNTK